jgi:hypothetical protein
MPFSHYVLEPAHIESMHAAFNRICKALDLDCNREDPMTEIIVTKIMELAKTGERDSERLCIAVLAELETGSVRKGDAAIG